MRVYDVLHDFTRYTGEGNGTKVVRAMFISRLVQRNDPPNFPIARNTTSFKGLFKQFSKNYGTVRLGINQKFGVNVVNATGRGKFKIFYNALNARCVKNNWVHERSVKNRVVAIIARNIVRKSRRKDIVENRSTFV